MNLLHVCWPAELVVDTFDWHGARDRPLVDCPGRPLVAELCPENRDGLLEQPLLLLLNERFILVSVRPLNCTRLLAAVEII